MSANWWVVFNAAVKSFIILVDATATAIQRQDTLVTEHNARIQKLVDDLRASGHVEGPVMIIGLLTTVAEESVAGHVDGIMELFFSRRTLQVPSLNAALWKQMTIYISFQIKRDVP